MPRTMPCEDYAAEFPQNFPVENNYRDSLDAAAFATCCGSVEVTDSYHMYLPPPPKVHPRFDNVRTFLWTADHVSS